MFCDAQAQSTGLRPLQPWDLLVPGDRGTWARLADNVHEEIMADLRERGVMWEPTS